MAEEQDQSQKTEAPSQRRLDEARAHGQLVASREVATVEAAPLPDDRDELWRLIAILEKVLERLKKQAGRGEDRG